MERFFAGSGRPERQLAFVQERVEKGDRRVAGTEPVDFFTPAK
jgi:hypothetical protein